MANTYLRDKARLLRQKGESLEEIRRNLGVPKSTARYWCRDIALNPDQLARLFQKRRMGGVLAAEQLRQQRLRTTERLRREGIRQIGHLSVRETWLIGIALYWAEGYRKSSDAFGFTNSDPTMIQFIIRWLRGACSIPRERIRLRVCINVSHKDRLKEVHQFWYHTTKIPPSQFSNPTLIHARSSKQYLNRHTYYGTIRIRVSRSSEFRRRIMGWIEGLIRGLPSRKF